MAKLEKDVKRVDSLGKFISKELQEMASSVEKDS